MQIIRLNQEIQHYLRLINQGVFLLYHKNANACGRIGQLRVDPAINQIRNQHNRA